MSLARFVLRDACVPQAPQDEALEGLSQPSEVHLDFKALHPEEPAPLRDAALRRLLRIKAGVSKDRGEYELPAIGDEHRFVLRDAA